MADDVTIEDFIARARVAVQAARARPMSAVQLIAIEQIDADLDRLEDEIATMVERIQNAMVLAVTGTRPPDGPVALRHKRESKARRKARQAGGCRKQLTHETI